MSLKKHMVRLGFKLAVFKRDKFQCRKCPADKIHSAAYLAAHHIVDRHDSPDGGYILSNGITLCPECHLKAEEYHKSSGVTHIEGYHPDDLKNLIKS